MAVIILSSCGSPLGQPRTTALTTVPTVREAATLALPTAVPSPITELPTHTADLVPTDYPISGREPAATLGEVVEPPWYPTVPAFGPDGNTLALVGPKVQIWDIQTHELTMELANPYPRNCKVFNADPSPDGNYLAASINACSPPLSSEGYLLVWDLGSGELIYEWSQHHANMVDPDQDPYSIWVYAFAFLPHRTSIAFASGNTIELRDVDGDSEPMVLQLGTDMYASEISAGVDGRHLYVLMQWDKLHDFPTNYRRKFAYQIWDLSSASLVRRTDLPEVAFPFHDMRLVGLNILHRDHERASSDLTNLATGSTTEFLYRDGILLVSPDLSHLAAVRFGVDVPDRERGLELWDAQSETMLWRLGPELGPDLQSGQIAGVFSPDGSLFAIGHQQQVSIWAVTHIGG